MTRDVLDCDDGIIDQQTERYHEARDRQLVERVTKEIEHRDAESQRQRDGDHDDAGCTQTERQQRQQHHRYRDTEVEVEPIEPRLDVARLVEGELERDALRKADRPTFDGRDDRRAHFEDVIARFHVGGDEHRAFAVETADMPPLALRPLHLAEVPHPDHATLDRGDDRVAHLFEVGIGAGAFEGETARSDIDDTCRDVGVLALQGLRDDCRTDAELRDPAQIHLDAQFALRECPGLGCAHTRHRLESVLQLAGLIL